MTGKVYLVGAGPGDPGLITVRGLQLLERADAVVHDRLVSRDLIARHRPDAEIHDVGKVPGRHGRGRQGEINELLVALARQGKTVVRLKGGDPFVFGRGAEEAEACVAAGVPFEVVPGVTSAVAVPAYAGIPVTHRSSASSFAVVTGHEDPARSNPRTDWAILARIDTLVILMGVESLPTIVERLLVHGRSDETPIALVSCGTYPSQYTVTGTLADIVDRAREATLRSPVTVVVGEVVRQRERIRWFDRGPLWGKRVLLPRTRDKTSVLAERFRALGAETIEVPHLEVKPMAERLTDALERLAGYDLILFTSPATVRVFWSALTDRGLDARGLGGIQIAAAGPGTADELSSIGILPDLKTPAYAPTLVAEVLLLHGVVNRHLLLLRQEDMPCDLTERLRGAGARVHHIAVYRAVPVGSLPDLRADLLVFASSGSVRTLAGLLEGSNEEVSHAPAVCMGPRTAAAAEKHGFHVRAIAESPTFDGLIQAALAVTSEEIRHAVPG